MVRVLNPQQYNGPTVRELIAGYERLWQVCHDEHNEMPPGSAGRREYERAMEAARQQLDAHYMYRREA